jgi:hypothetical protein
VRYGSWDGELRGHRRPTTTNQILKEISLRIKRGESIGNSVILHLNVFQFIAIHTSSPRKQSSPIAFNSFRASILPFQRKFAFSAYLQATQGIPKFPQASPRLPKYLTKPEKA